MTQPTLRSATSDDIPAITALLIAVHLPAVEIEEHIEHFVVAERDGRLVGCGGIEIYPNCPAGLVRSMAVDEDLRRSGLGKRILDWVIDHGNAHGVSDFLLFTVDAHDFYVPFGFVDVTLDDFPEAMRGSMQYRATQRFGKEWGVIAMRQMRENG
jgi:N-acetylglutamate synthase-like GNAT family acetyltransferase